MAGARAPFGPRTRDTKVMVAVTYSDGRSAYIRVDPETARHHGRDGDRAGTAGGWRDPGRRDRQRQAGPVSGPHRPSEDLPSAEQEDGQAVSTVEKALPLTRNSTGVGSLPTQCPVG